MHYYSIHLDIIISSQICLFYCFMPTWVIFWVIFVAMAAILKMPPLCRKSRLARKNLFLYFSHHILPPYQKEKKLVRCHFLGILQIGTLSQKVDLKYYVFLASIDSRFQLWINITGWKIYLAIEKSAKLSTYAQFVGTSI